MFNLTKLEINQLADKYNFNRNMTEKVLRLYSVLDFINNNELKDLLVLKGGTAINIFLLDLPRLSVDIDLDFNLSLNKEETFQKRQFIDKIIKDYMADEGYFLNDKSKFTHSLDSYVFSYISSSGGSDVLKIEINYSNRVHILKPQNSTSTSKFEKNISIARLADDELIGSKLSALITRTTPRDVYDVSVLFKNGNIKNKDLIKKITLFYVCLSSTPPLIFNDMITLAINKINNLSFQRIKETLFPVLHKGIIFNVKEMNEYVSKQISNLFVLDDKDKAFISNYNNKQFTPNILFDEYKTNDLDHHPMGIWKIKQKEKIN